MLWPKNMEEVECEFQRDGCNATPLLSLKSTLQPIYFKLQVVGDKPSIPHVQGVLSWFLLVTVHSIPWWRCCPHFELF